MVSPTLSVDKKVVDKYLSKDALGCFSRVKPSESRKTLSLCGGERPQTLNLDHPRQDRQNDADGGHHIAVGGEIGKDAKRYAGEHGKGHLLFFPIEKISHPYRAED